MRGLYYGVVTVEKFVNGRNNVYHYYGHGVHDDEAGLLTQLRKRAGVGCPGAQESNAVAFRVENLTVRHAAQEANS